MTEPFDPNTFPKTGSDKLSRGLTALFDVLGQSLHVDLTNTLGATHDIGGIHCFVGGDHHKFISIILYGQICHNLGSQMLV